MTDKNDKKARGTLTLNLGSAGKTIINPVEQDVKNRVNNPSNFNNNRTNNNIKVEPIEFKSKKSKNFSNYEDEVRMQAVLNRKNQNNISSFYNTKKSLSDLLEVDNVNEELDDEGYNEEDEILDDESESEEELGLEIVDDEKKVEEESVENDEVEEFDEIKNVINDNVKVEKKEEIVQKKNITEMLKVPKKEEYKREEKNEVKQNKSKVLEGNSEESNLVKKDGNGGSFKLINAKVDGVKNYTSTLNSSDLLEKRRKAEELEKEERERSRIALIKEKKKNLNLRSGLLDISTDDNDIQGEILNRTFIKKKPKFKGRSHGSYEKKIIVQDIVIDGSMSIKDLAGAMNVKSAEVIKLLNKMEKRRHDENYVLTPDAAEFLILEFGHKPILKSIKTIESLIIDRIRSGKNLKEKPPVVTIMGHVDHGKTSLLDALRSSNVVAQESGGITQHIGAYQIVTKSGKKISFIDTPGHEAFTVMRARGSKVTDIVILVVAADDGVMPQTIESINHVHAAGVPMIVAVNKIDRTGGKVRTILDQLIQYEVVVEECGGEVMSVPISAKNRTNLDKLEEAILLQAEMLELKADYKAMASGVVIESKINNTRGSCATLLVQNGTLKVGDCLITNDKFCKVRSMLDEHGKEVKEAEPAMAVEVFGFQKAPDVGQKFIVCNSEKEAKDLLQEFVDTEEKQKLIKEAEKNKGVSLLSLIGNAQKKPSEDGEVKELKFIIKADVSGTIDAVKYSLEKLNSDDLKVEVIHSNTGTVTESDISLAKTTGAVIAGFNISVSAPIQNMIAKEGITFRIYNIIYQLIDDVEAMIQNKLKPQKIEKYIGKLIIKKVFDISKTGKIAGCIVDDGLIATGNFIKVIRKGDVLGEELKISVLKRFKDNVREVKQGLECGVALEKGDKEFNDIIEGDTLEVYNIIENK